MSFENPLRAAGQGPAKAKLVIVQPKEDKAEIPIHFNPTEYQLQKGNNFSEIPIPGLQSPPVQFIRGAAEKLALELLVDTSDTLDDVRVKYTNKLRALMDINAKLHAPPVLQFQWDRLIFTGVLETLTITYSLFTQKGVPIRAKLSLVLKEYRTVKEQVASPPRQSPNVEKAYTVKRGDTLSSIAADVYKDPALWREIALANAIEDPRQIQPGTRLIVPRLS
jgi:nucleoid-associated protein YgaU